MKLWKAKRNIRFSSSRAPFTSFLSLTANTMTRQGCCSFPLINLTLFDNETNFGNQVCLAVPRCDMRKQWKAKIIHSSNDNDGNGATKWMKQARLQFIFILDWWSWLHNWCSEAPHDADYDDDILSRVMNRTRDAHRWACNWRAHDIELWSSPTIAASMWEPDERWWKRKRINSRHLMGGICECAKATIVDERQLCRNLEKSWNSLECEKGEYDGVQR